MPSPKTVGDRVLFGASIMVWAVTLFVGVIIILAVTEPSPLRYTNVPFPVIQALQSWATKMGLKL